MFTLSLLTTLLMNKLVNCLYHSEFGGRLNSSIAYWVYWQYFVGNSLTFVSLARALPALQGAFGYHSLPVDFRRDDAG